MLLLGAQQSDSVVHTCRSVAQSCLSLLWPRGLCPPGSTVHGVSQARTLQWLAVSFSRGSSWPRREPCLLHWPADSLPPTHQGNAYIHTCVCVSVCVCETQGERIFFRFFSYIGYHKRWYRQLSDGYLTVSYNWLLYHQSSSLIICLIMCVH